MKINKKTFTIALWAVVIILCYWGWHAGKKYERTIQKDTQITNGKILSTSVSYRGGVYVEYSFEDNNGKSWETEQPMNIEMWKRNSFVNKRFPVVFSKMKPEINEILIFPKDFEKYNIPFPDSLQWVKKLGIGN